jgi:hypothetical protein
LTESKDIFGGHYLEFHTYNSHGNCFYMYLMSIFYILYLGISYFYHLNLQTDVRAKLVTYAIFRVFGPTRTTHATTLWSQGILNDQGICRKQTVKIHILIVQFIFGFF